MPNATDLTLVGFLERVFAGVADRILGTVQQLDDEIGDRPFGAAPLSRAERLEWWAELGRDLTTQAQLMAGLRQSYGPKAGEERYYSDVWKLDRALAREGGWNGDTTVLIERMRLTGRLDQNYVAALDEGRRRILAAKQQREVTRAATDAAKAAAIVRKGPILLAPPLPPLGPTDLIMGTAPPPLPFDVPDWRTDMAS